MKVVLDPVSHQSSIVHSDTLTDDQKVVSWL